MVYAIYGESGTQNSMLFMEDAQQRQLEQPVLSLLSQWCLVHGCTMQGRLQAIRAVMGYCQKVPLLISEQPLLLFPTVSMRRDDCVWINPLAILHYQSQHHQTCIQFRNGKELLVAVDVRTIRLQYDRCCKYVAYLHAHRSEFLL